MSTSYTDTTNYYARYEIAHTDTHVLVEHLKQPLPHRPFLLIYRGPRHTTLPPMVQTVVCEAVNCV